MGSSLSLEQFLDQLIAALNIDVDPIHRHAAGASIYDDWAIDSLQAFQVIIVTEAMAGALVPPPELPELYTPADVYAYYLSMRQEPGAL